MREVAFEPFRVVESKAGRDKGRLFVIVGTRDDGMLLISDGDLRKLAKPKPKKRMHLKSRPWSMNRLEILYGEGRLLDSDIRKALDEIRSGGSMPREQASCLFQTSESMAQEDKIGKE